MLNGVLVMLARPAAFAVLAQLGILLFQTPLPAVPTEQSAVRIDSPNQNFLAVRLYPALVRLHGARSEQHLAVLGETQDGKILDLTRKAVFESSSPRVAAVDSRAVVHPKGDGSCTITARIAGLLASTSVQVEKATLEMPVSFAREIVPVLTKAGCNQGACHGGMHGRGAFGSACSALTRRLTTTRSCKVPRAGASLSRIQNEASFS